MSMSTYVMGIVPPDDKWKKMKSVYDACVKADMEVPDEVWEFFGNEEPDDKGVIIDLSTKSYSPTICTEWQAGMSEGYELKLEDIPENVKILRFYNSW